MKNSELTEENERLKNSLKFAGDVNDKGMEAFNNAQALIEKLGMACSTTVSVLKAHLRQINFCACFKATLEQNEEALAAVKVQKEKS